MTALRFFGPVLACLFAAAAAVQWNDPDPFVWIAIYAAAALLALLTSLRPPPPLVHFALAAVAGVWAAALLPQVVSASAFTGTEVERECAGLLLIAVVMLVLGRFSARQRAGAAAGAPPPASDTR